MLVITFAAARDDGEKRVGALVLSSRAEPGRENPTAYDHVSLLATLQDALGVGRLGLARADGVNTFGDDVFAVDP